MRSGLPFDAMAIVAGSLLTAALKTTHVIVHGDQSFRGIIASGQPVIYAIWHGRLLPGAYQHRNEGVEALISRSRDGEYIARLCERWGYVTARGSSSRGGSAGLREMIRGLRAGRSVVFTPDGPRGPRQKVKHGALLAAQLTGAPIIPVSASASRAWWVEHWDRFLVPKPFSKIHITYGAPVRIARESDEAAMRAAEISVEAVLNTLMHEVDEYARAA